MNDVRKAVQNVMEYYATQEAAVLNRMYRGQLSKKAFLDLVRQYLVQVLRLDDCYTGLVMEEVIRHIWGYRVISGLITDPEISDIRIMSYDNIRVKRKGKREKSAAVFDTPEDLKLFADYCATKGERSLSAVNAVASWTDRKGDSDFILRFNVTTPFVNSVETPYIHIRKIPKTKITVGELVEKEFLTDEIAQYLIRQVSSDGGMVWCGKGGSGKTTGMNAFLDMIPKDKSCLVIQENEELFSHTHPEMMFQHIVTGFGDAAVNYQLEDLARNGLLMDLDYFVIGEIKGSEALYFLNASYTGHRCWTSLHAMSSREAMIKLSDYAKYAGDYTREQVLEMFQDLRTIIFVKDFKICEITETAGYDAAEGNLIYREIYNRETGLNRLGEILKGGMGCYS
ncbi:Type IV secretion system protein virB11 [uncultured Roseburia sp.]|uniref:ATPase, T2SS/T4P/T4SS family n=1 Tax=Brotonthovivens ammoniilytica TaxID=2981725 RepID=A0ABT2TLH1_9FIRM|nr:ATPase, T2SS/T4P/T4SS family [Brotonthovivens ammoniilytica]MCU6763050.1 ATPase, T2SS/T4P/T4SS family [Brotonthovivens ammoniilytica]SCJ01626.1 Type IV secretion system protein virB11 [uncultured Roseburia sp.]